MLGVVGFVGMGMIGGSLAMALRKAGVVERVLALDSSKDALLRALELGVIDEACDWQGLEVADVIVICVPVDSFFMVCRNLAALSLKDSVVITDVGSTKGSVVEAVRAGFGFLPQGFVPAHPIAGRERSGVQYAEADLFLRRKVILTTLPESSDRALGVVSRLWLACGALVRYMPLALHDEVLGATSHLPHVLAYLLVDMLSHDLNHEDIFSFAAGGFRDFTRIASSSPEMWRDICVHNAEVLQVLLAKYRARIEDFERLLALGAGDKIEDIFMRAKSARDEHYQKEQE